jgi:hypothetical protein
VRPTIDIAPPFSEEEEETFPKFSIVKSVNLNENSDALVLILIENNREEGEEYGDCRDVIIELFP